MATEENSQTLESNHIDLTETQDKGVLKEIIREGSGNDHPNTGDKVTVHYVGQLLDGTEFDSSRGRGEKFTFSLGKGEVIKAWDIGVASMRKGELAKLTCKAEYAYGEGGSPPKIPPNATLVFEVELFSWQGEDISQNKDGGIIRSTIIPGNGYQTPNDYSSVTIKFSVHHDSRVVVEETELTFTLGEVDDEKITAGLERAVQKMKEKEKSKFQIAPAYAYGSNGNKSLDIPAGATLDYVVELLKFEKAKRVYEMNSVEKLEQAEIRKIKGSEFFQKNLLEKAISNYKTVLEYLDTETTLEGDELEKRDALVLAARLNLAACELKRGDDSSVIEHCDAAIELNEKSVKAYYRRAGAHQNRKDYDKAIKDYTKVLELEPQNAAAKNRINECKKKQQAELASEKKLAMKMFSGFGKTEVKVGEK